MLIGRVDGLKSIGSDAAVLLLALRGGVGERGGEGKEGPGRHGDCVVLRGEDVALRTDAGLLSTRVGDCCWRLSRASRRALSLIAL
jgi:hypothetical protein